MTAKWCVGALAAVLIGGPLVSVAAEQPRTIAIAVTPKGFEPSLVKVTKGQPLKLVVTRKTEDTCAKEIVIADENIKADLPLNKPVTLSFTPKRTGQIRYACGMNMISGVLEVASNDRANGSAAAARSDPGTATKGSGEMGDMPGMKGGMENHGGAAMRQMSCGCMRGLSGSSGS